MAPSPPHTPLRSLLTLPVVSLSSLANPFATPAASVTGTPTPLSTPSSTRTDPSSASPAVQVVTAQIERVRVDLVRVLDFARVHPNHHHFVNSNNSYTHIDTNTDSEKEGIEEDDIDNCGGSSDHAISNNMATRTPKSSPRSPKRNSIIGLSAAASFPLPPIRPPLVSKEISPRRWESEPVENLSGVTPPQAPKFSPLQSLSSGIHDDGNGHAVSQDESFMRWSRTASTLSDLKTSRSPPSTWSFHADLDGDDVFRDERHVESARRESTGTFGGGVSGARRRWSAVESAASSGCAEDDADLVSAPSRQSLNKYREQEDKRAEQNCWEEGDEAWINSSVGSYRRHRPLSMSSATTSAYSGAANDMSPLRSRGPSVGGTSATAPFSLSSPSQRRPSHKIPESEQAITAHLLKTSASNGLRIVPQRCDSNFISPPSHSNSDRDVPSGLLPPVQLTSPPSSGTPLTAGGVREEDMSGSESDVPNNARQDRMSSKLDQVLGEGAETARVLLAFDKRTSSKAEEPSALSLPLRLGPKHSSFPATTKDISPTASDLVFPTNHRKSASLDSLPSLHPSLAESVNTMTHLLPLKPLPPIPSVPTLAAIKPLLSSHEPPYPPPNWGLPQPPNRIPPSISIKNDLSLDQKALLIRRTRKLEQVLGETLKETQIERLVVEPSTATTTVVTHVDDHAWPTTPPADGERTTGVPEWAREDCVPRRAHDMASAAPSGSLLSSIGQTQSRLSRRAKNALRVKLAELESPASGELHVYVAREMRVSETAMRSGPLGVTSSAHATVIDVTQTRVGINRAPPPPSPGPITPGSPTNTVDHDSAEMDVDEVARRARRAQFGKLQRLLGAQIPPNLIATQNQDCLSPTITIAHESISTMPTATLPIVTPTTATGVVSNPRTQTRSHSTLGGDRPETHFDASFISLDTRHRSPSDSAIMPGKWAKLRQVIDRRTGNKINPSGARKPNDGNSFMELGGKDHRKLSTRAVPHSSRHISFKGDDAIRLGDMIGPLRRKRETSTWEEL